jgi:hypothetical protein
MGSKKSFGKYGGNHYGRGLGNSRKRKEKQKGGNETIYIKKSQTTEAEALYPILKNIFSGKNIEFVDDVNISKISISFDGKNTKDRPFIQFSGESKDVVNKELINLPDNLLSLVSTNDSSFINDKKVYFPMFLNVGPFIYNESPFKRIYQNNERPYIAAYIARYSPEHRDTMFKALKTLDKNDLVHGLGTANHTKDVTLPEHWYNLYSIYKDYLFGFAMENKEEDGYITEKIMNVYRGGAIPIYWGTSKVKEIFNPDSFIYINGYESFQKCAEDIMNIVNDKERLRKLQEAPIFRENAEPDYSKYYDTPSPQWVIDIAEKIKKNMNSKQKGSEETNKAYVINLDKRTDRWEQIQKDFKDLPILLERFSAIENKDGHLGLGLSYLELVKKAKNENMESILILEDDCLPVKDFINRWNSVKKWLDSNEDKWEVFNGCVFVPIDSVLVDTVDDIQLIKSDGLGARAAHFVIIKKSAYDRVLEWNKEKNGLFDYFINSNIFKNILLNQKVLAGQHKGFSNTEKINRNTELSENNLRGGESCPISYFTVSTKDTPELQRLKSSAEKFGWSLDILGLEENTDQLGWEDKNNKSGNYGNFSIKLVKELEYVSKKSYNDIVLFTDAWDVLCLGDCNSLYEKYLTFNKDLVFGAEKMCSPDEDKKDLYKIQNVPFPYLNSGFFIGKAGVIKKFLDTYNGEKINDQKWWTAIYLENQDAIALDSKALMCLQTWDTDEKYYQIQDNKFTYTETSANPIFVHANGHIKGKLNLFTPLLQNGGNEERTTAYVINLIHRTDRKNTITNAFKNSLIDLEFIEAVLIDNNIPNKGAIGIGESFKKVIKEKATNKPILIFEDDCKPINDFDKRWQIVKKWLDNNLDKWEVFSGGINTPSTSEIRLEYSLENDIQLFSSTHGWGMHWTYLNPSIFDKVLQFDFELHGPLDLYLNSKNNFKFLVIYPFIGIQEEGMSNITKVYNSKEGHFDTSLYENELHKQTGGNRQKAYVMNLKDRTEKWETIQNSFKDIFDLERFDAIKDVVGHRGCGKSFQKIIRIAKEKGMEEILILEDDCKPLEDFKDRWDKVKYWLDNNKDKWEVFNGGLKLVVGAITNLVDTLDNGNKILSIDKGVNCHMILVKNDAYDKILEWDWDKNWLIDFNYINTSKFKTLFVEPALSIQKDGYSNTEHIEKKNQLGGKSRRKNKHNKRKTRKNKQRGGSEKIHYITVSTKDTPDLQNLIKSAKKNKWDLNVLGLEMNTSELGHANKKFGMKLRLVKDYLSKCNPEDILLFTDAWDVLVFGTKEEVLERYKKFNKSIVFNAEKFCWPDELRKNEYDTLTEEFPFLNSGGYIGKMKDIAKFLDNYNNEEDIDDQRFWTDQYMKNRDIIGLDHKNEIFICCVGTDIRDYSIENEKLKYKDKYPLILHANGPGKEQFLSINIQNGGNNDDFYDKINTI